MKTFCKAISALLCVTSLGCCYAAAHQQEAVTPKPGASVGLVGEALAHSSNSGMRLLDELKIDYPDANPVGLTLSADNTLIVTAKGPTGQKMLPGQIWTARPGAHDMSMAHIARSGIRSYGSLQGVHYDPATHQIFACSNSSIKGVSASVVLFRQEGESSFRWVASSNMGEAGASCRALTVANGNIYAVNEYADGPSSGALFSATMGAAGELPGAMKSILSYKDLGYETTFDLPENKRSLLSDIKGATLSGEGMGSSLLLSDSYKGLVHLVTAIPASEGQPERSTVRTLDFDEMLAQPTAVLQWSPTELLVSEKYGCVYRIRKFEFETDQLQKVAYASDLGFSLSPVSAMAIGSDISGTYSKPVLFALESKPASHTRPHYFLVKEYAVE